MARHFAALIGMAVIGCASTRGVAEVARIETPAAPVVAAAAPASDSIEPLLRGDAELRSWLDDAERRRIQVLVAIPDGSGGLERMGFRADAEYFYPASAVKLCAAVGALEKLEELRDRAGKAVSMTSKVRYIYGQGRARRVFETTLRRDIEQALVVSSNEAFNRLLDFVGPEELADRMSRRGITSAHIAQHLGEPTKLGEPGIELVTHGRSTVPIGHRLGFPIPPAPNTTLGRAYYDEKGHLVPEPMDFSTKNSITLHDLQDLLIDVTLSSEERLPTFGRSLRDILALLPSELRGVRPSAGAILDDRYKPLTVAVMNALPDQKVRVYGKSGRAYGFAVENAYVVNETTGRSFFVAATIYANGNDTFNDDRYEYDEIADPFITRLGVVLAEKLVAPAASTDVAQRDR